MNKFLRIASMTAVLAGLGAASQGCIVDCKEEPTSDGEDTKTVCTGEGAVKYKHASPATASLAYAPGDSLTISGVNGEIDVVVGSGSTVEVSVARFTFRKEGEQEAAVREMENDLTVSATGEGSGALNVDVSKAGGSSSGLGGDLTVTLPAAFNGALSVNQNNGGTDVTVSGATTLNINSGNGGIDLNMSGQTTATTVHADNGSLDLNNVVGTLNITQDNGVDCDVSIALFSATDGVVSCDSLNSQILAGAGIDGSLTVQSTGGLISGAPASWEAAAENTDNSASFSFGADPASVGTVAVTNSGDIVLGES